MSHLGDPLPRLLRAPREISPINVNDDHYYLFIIFRSHISEVREVAVPLKTYLKVARTSLSSIANDYQYQCKPYVALDRYFPKCTLKVCVMLARHPGQGCPAAPALQRRTMNP